MNEITRTIRLLVLGTGSMAAQHAKLFHADPRVEVVACADVDAARAGIFAQTHGIARSFGSLPEALAWGEFDAVTNVTPDAVHHPTTLQVIAAGKHILCEKPLADSYPLAAEMADAAEAAGVINMVNLSYRNVAALDKARAMIASGEIGEVRHVEASYRQSWLTAKEWGDWRVEPMWLWRLSQAHGSKGVLGDVGVHILDFAAYAVGMMPVTLQARLKTFPKAEGDQIGAYTLDANDSAMMQVEFSNGALGVIHASRFATGYANTLRLEVFGTLGAVEIEHGMEWTTIRACTGEDIHTRAWHPVVSDPVMTNHHKFISAIMGASVADPDFRRGADLQRVIDLCYSDAASASARVT